MIIIFKQPINNYEEEYNTAVAPIWCFLFGPLYWLARNNVFHTVLSFFLAIGTVGISWVIYPFFVNRINIKAYAKKGWINTGTIETGIPITRRNNISVDLTGYSVSSTISSPDTLMQWAWKQNRKNKKRVRRMNQYILPLSMLLGAIFYILLKKYQ